MRPCDGPQALGKMKNFPVVKSFVVYLVGGWWGGGGGWRLLRKKESPSWNF
jgi:hypothetical protein